MLRCFWFWEKGKWGWGGRGVSRQSFGLGEVVEGAGRGEEENVSHQIVVHKQGEESAGKSFRFSTDYLERG
jgi:hypothetical protein